MHSERQFVLSFIPWIFINLLHGSKHTLKSKNRNMRRKGLLKGLLCVTILSNPEFIADFMKIQKVTRDSRFLFCQHLTDI